MLRHSLPLEYSRQVKQRNCATALDAVAAEFASEEGQAMVRNHPTAEDIHHFVELSLVERVGSLGLKLHTGRSRNEQIATDLRLYVRKQIELVIDSLARGPALCSSRPALPAKA